MEISGTVVVIGKCQSMVGRVTSIGAGVVNLHRIINGMIVKMHTCGKLLSLTLEQFAWQ